MHNMSPINFTLWHVWFLQQLMCNEPNFEFCDAISFVSDALFCRRWFSDQLSFILNVFTARVRSTREGNIYTWECLSVHPADWRGGWVTPSQVQAGGTPSSWWGWGTPSQVQVGGGTPSQVQVGLPHPTDGGYLIRLSIHLVWCTQLTYQDFGMIILVWY